MAASSISSSRGISILVQQLEHSCVAKNQAFLASALQLKTAFRENSNPTEETQAAYDRALQHYEKSLKLLKTDIKTLHTTLQLSSLDESKIDGMKAVYKKIDSITRQYLIHQPDIDAIQTELAEKSARARALEADLAQAQERVRQIETAQAQSAPSMSISSQLELGLADLSNLEELRAANEAKTAIEARLQELQGEIDPVREALQTATARAEQIERQNIELASLMQKLQAEAATRAQQLEAQNAALAAQLAAIQSSQAEQVTAYSAVIAQTNATIASFQLPPPPPPPPPPSLAYPTPISSSSSSSSSQSPTASTAPAFLGQIAGGSSVLRKTKSWTRQYFWAKLPKLVADWKANPQTNNFNTVAQVMGWCSTTLEDLRIWMEASKNFTTKLETFPNEEIDSRFAKRAFNLFLAASTESHLSVSENEDDGDEWSDDESLVPSTPSSAIASFSLPSSMSISSLPAFGAAGDSIYAMPLSSGGYARTITKTELLNRFLSKIDQIERSIEFVNELNQTLDGGKFAALSRFSR